QLSRPVENLEPMQPSAVDVGMRIDDIVGGLAKNALDQTVGALADQLVDLAHRDSVAASREGVGPRDRVQIVRVDQGAVDVVQDSVRHSPGLPAAMAGDA